MRSRTTPIRSACVKRSNESGGGRIIHSLNHTFQTLTPPPARKFAPVTGGPTVPTELESRVLRKITLRIIPFVMLLYFIAFIDRVNIGFAALTMNKELGFSPAVFGFGAGIFFLGYFLFEVPSNIILH